jgi:hypothetical protein
MKAFSIKMKTFTFLNLLHLFEYFRKIAYKTANYLHIFNIFNENYRFLEMRFINENVNYDSK